MFPNPAILIITLYFHPEINGGSTGAWNRAMVFHKLGYSVYVLCGLPAYPSGRVTDPKYKGKWFYVETMEHFKVIRLRLLPLRHDGYMKRLIIFVNFILVTIIYMFRILRISGKLDIIYARVPVIFSSIAGFAYAKFTNAPFIYEVPDLWPEELVVFKTPLLPLIMAFGKLVAKVSYSLPDVIITISDLAANIIAGRYGPKAGVYGIPIGVDPDKFPRLSKAESRQDLLRKNILPYALPDKFIVLYSGLISAAQQIESLLYAADKLHQDKGIAIVVIGDGPEKQRLLGLKEDCRIDNFYMLPPQPRQYMPSIISAVDMCIVPLSSEPIFDIALPTKFYEYLACGKPIIGICRGELANMINRFKVGRVVGVNDPNILASTIRELKNSPALILSMERNSYAASKRISLDNISFLFQKVLKKELSI